ncbi:MAG: DUF3168 domain-containing protein [Pseudomonadota bacterium]
MSYVLSGALQTAVYTALSEDTVLEAMVNGAIYDALPAGQVDQLYVTLGPERVRDRSDSTARSALHEFAITVVSDEAGFLSAKEVAKRISELLVGADLSLSRGRLVRLDFYKAHARKRANKREVETWFRAFVEDEATA